MGSEERSTWVMLVAAVGGYAAYLAVILRQAAAAPLPEVPYVPVMLWTIGGAIGVSILLNILAGIVLRDGAGGKDQRDREIYRFGEYIGQAFLVIGGVAALVLAMAEAAHFWIANTLYLAFALSAVLSSAAKLAAYRRGLPAW